MKCPGCDHENRHGAKFCAYCADPLPRQCSTCDAELRPGAKFCGECGNPARTELTAGFGAPDAYTPEHLAERILTSKSALEGERKHVTVLFADVKGSLELLADLDPEDARRLLDPVIERMMDAVHRYEGTVNQVMGDGIMALFGAPLAHEHHAVRACYAALLMQQSVKRYAQTIGQESLQIRVGLNAGEVVVRSIGSDLHMDYTAVGQTTHLAARMEQLAAPGSILIPAASLRLAERYVEARPIGVVHVKGMRQPVEVCEITGAGLARTRLQASAARGLTPFVGRETELAGLHQALRLAHGGHGQVCAVVGQPGVGKSRLCYEFLHSVATQGWLVLEADSASYGQARPYLPVIELLKAYCRIHDSDDERTIQDKVTGTLLSRDHSPQVALAPLLTLVDVDVDDSRWKELDPSQRRYETINAVRRLLLRESQIQPVLIAIENLHWIDSESQTLFDHLVDDIPAARMLLLVSYRPEYRHAWDRRGEYREVRLDPLPAVSAEEFLEALLGPDATLRPLRDLLVTRTEGNPFFMEESVRTLVETDALVGERGGYRLMKDVTSLEIAPTVQAVLAARIDRLPIAHKRLLQSAAVIGKDVPFALLKAIADDNDDDDARRSLQALQAAEFVYEKTLFPELEYTFKHALTHEVAYGGLLRERRSFLHARIVEAIEALYVDRLAEHVEGLAHHAFQAKLWDKALTYLRQAGGKALARSANRQAATYFEQALTALQHLPDTRARLEEAIAVRFELRNALLPLGHFDRFYAYLREAEALASRLEDRRQLGWVSAYLCHYFWMTGRSTEARTFGQSAHDIAEGLEDFRLTVVASFYLGLARFAGGDYRRAATLLRDAVRLVEGALSQERCGLAGYPAVMSRSYLGLAAGYIGEFDEAITLARDGVHLAEMAEHPYSLIVACWALGSLHGMRGELRTAAGVLERARALCQEWKQTVLTPIVAAALGAVYNLSGRFGEGFELLHEALRAMEALGRGSYHSLAVLQLGEAAARAARTDEALGLAQRALGLTRARGERGLEGLALHLLGHIEARRDPCDAELAGRHYDAALALAHELGMKPLVAHCHLGLGMLHRRAGRLRRGDESLTAAVAMFRAMNMSFWSERAETELRVRA